MSNDKIDETTKQSLENARRNAGIPVTSGDLAGTSADPDFVDETVSERGTTDTVVHGPVDDTVPAGDDDDEDTGTGPYEDRTKAQLQAVARSQGKPIYGSKEELIERLRG